VVLERMRQLKMRRAVSDMERVPAIALSGYSEAAQGGAGWLCCASDKPVPVDLLGDGIRVAARRIES
jgi:hypothetical protein